jgi:hypothetical protein
MIGPDFCAEDIEVLDHVDIHIEPRDAVLIPGRHPLPSPLADAALQIHAGRTAGI